MTLGCGDCDLCCTLLEVPDLNKAQNERCGHLRDGVHGCAIYSDRPLACQAYSCLWLTSQNRRDRAERMPPGLRPDRTGVIFSRSGDELDPAVLFAHVDPRFPLAWQQDPVMARITWLVNVRGATVIIVLGDQRGILKRGQPLLWVTEKELERLRLNQKRQLYGAAAPLTYRPDAMPALDVLPKGSP